MATRSRKIPESLSNWILWWQESSLFLLRVRSKQVCSGYTPISVFLVAHLPGFRFFIFARTFGLTISEFLFCADRFVVDLCDKHVLESNPVDGRSFERCYYQFGQFCCGWTGFFFQFQPFMRRLQLCINFLLSRSCSSCRKCNSVKRLSSSCCCSCLASNRFLSISLSISSCLLFKNFASFSLSTRNVECLAFTSFFHCLIDRGDTPWSIFNSSACEIDTLACPRFPPLVCCNIHFRVIL